MVQFVLHDPVPMLYHNEPIYRDGQLLGLTSSAAYGHHIGGAVALGYIHCDERITADFVASGKWEIEIGLERFAATASLRPLHDPTNARMRC